MNNNIRQVVILAGGNGTRLKDISGDLPKPMVAILAKPLLQHLIEQCVKHGFTDIKLLVSYKRGVIQDYFGNGSEFGASIKYIVEDVPKGTAGALIDALPKLNQQFLVLYGDTFFDIDLESFWAFHQKCFLSHHRGYLFHQVLFLLYRLRGTHHRELSDRDVLQVSLLKR